MDGRNSNGTFAAGNTAAAGNEGWKKVWLSCSFSGSLMGVFEGYGGDSMAMEAVGGTQA